MVGTAFDPHYCSARRRNQIDFALQSLFVRPFLSELKHIPARRVSGGAIEMSAELIC